MSDLETLEIRPCWVVSDLSRATGGVRYQSTHSGVDAQGESETTQIETLKRVDNVAIVKEGDQILAQCRYALRRHATGTPIGHVATEAQLVLLRADFRDLSSRASDFNVRAAQLGSEHRVRAAICPIRIDLDNEAAAIEIAATVRGTLEEILGLVREKQAKKLQGLIDTRGRNLHRLVVGMLGDSVRDAVEAARMARTAIAKAQREQKPTPDLSEYTDAIESAIGIMTSVDDLGGAQ